MLTEERLSELRRQAVDLIAELEGVLNEPAFRLAVAVLAISKDRDSWRDYAQRIGS